MPTETTIPKLTLEQRLKSQGIVRTLNTELGKEGQPLISPCLVEAFIVAGVTSGPWIEILRGYIAQAKAFYALQKSTLQRQLQQFNLLAAYLNQLTGLAEQALAPIDTVMNKIPFATLSRNCPEFGEFVNGIFEDNSFSIPSEPGILNDIGLGGFNLFEGVHDYTSLRKKINEVSFRAQRALMAGDHIQKQIDSYEKKFKELTRIELILNSI